MYTVECIQCVLYNVWWLLYTVYDIHYITLVCIVQWTMSMKHCKFWSVHYTVHIDQCTLYSERCILYIVYFIQYNVNVHCTVMHVLKLYNECHGIYYVILICNVNCTMFNIHCTMYNVQCTLYSIQWTLHCSLTVSLSLFFIEHTVRRTACIM